MGTQELNYEQRLIDESDITEAAIPQDGVGMTVKDAYDLIMGHLVYDNADTKRAAPLLPLPEISKEYMENEDYVGHCPRHGMSRTNFEATRCIQLADAIEILWNSPTIKDVWKQRATKNINDTHAAFLDDIKRTASPRFVPTKTDILRARRRTISVTREQYNIKGTDFDICNVGGQRTERRKWIDCFDDVNGVIFVAALSEY